ncbi:hypothetical protein [Aliarcobacter butzleri]|uniref:hypothetical protein n=1 Tax=Aliarcobacter butzleri TaxID=28197 RepID=UPI001EDC78C7|nr:hypothetical protein [Aliarcobacter butzleri]MCG3691567.1 hypothetical protein [Aliarcobacter butzleri]
MNNIKKLFLGLLLLCGLSNDVSAAGLITQYFGTGYVWIAGANRGVDDINYGDDELKYVLKANPKKGLPEINSIITIEAKNRVYYSIGLIEAISKEYLKLVKENKCETSKGAFTAFMTNTDSYGCTVDTVLKNIKIDYVPDDMYTFNSLYNELSSSRKARVLGYVFVSQGAFMTVQIWK